jgi:hypothetical protein
MHNDRMTIAGMVASGGGTWTVQAYISCQSLVDNCRLELETPAKRRLALLRPVVVIRTGAVSGCSRVTRTSVMTTSVRRIMRVFAPPCKREGRDRQGRHSYVGAAHPQVPDRPARVEL